MFFFLGVLRQEIECFCVNTYGASIRSVHSLTLTLSSCLTIFCLHVIHSLNHHSNTFTFFFQICFCIGNGVIFFAYCSPPKHSFVFG